MDTVEFMQNKIREAHQIMKKVKEYMADNTFKNHDGIQIDYNNPDQEFFIRLFTDFAQAASMLDLFMDYIVKPVRAEGNLQFDYANGMYKLNDEYINPGQPIEFMENGWWNVGLFQKDPVKPMVYYVVDLKDKKHEMELKGLKVRLR